MTEGTFITFEGGEGSGKSTQVGLLVERLSKEKAITPLITREPGGSAFAERLRAILLDPAVEPHSALSEALLFYAARADHLERVIRPALALGRWVICDRFSDSTRVYQGTAGKLDPKILEALELIVVGKSRPDLTIIMDVPAEIGLARAAVRREGGAKTQKPATPGPREAQSLMADRYEGRDLAFHRRLREGFLGIAAAEPGRCVVIDGNRSPDIVATAIWKAVEARFYGAKG